MLLGLALGGIEREGLCGTEKNPLTPLFDKSRKHVAWMSNDGRNLFDTAMTWIAYISGGHAWSASSGNWMGGVVGYNCLDRSGRPVLWSPRSPVRGTVRPARPARAARQPRPARPARPPRPARLARPARPVRGWSSLHMDAWISQ